MPHLAKLLVLPAVNTPMNALDVLAVNHGYLVTNSYS